MATSSVLFLLEVRELCVAELSKFAVSLRTLTPSFFQENLLRNLAVGTEDKPMFLCLNTSITASTTATQHVFFLVYFCASTDYM